MGLLIIVLVTLTALLLRRLWAKLTRTPLPVVTARPGRTGAVRRFLDGLGKAKQPPRTAPVLTAPEVDRWRRAAESARRPRQPQSTVDCEVLVVGAGPSGLMTAALLLRQGVKVRIVDTNAGPATESRAFAVQARTIELFHSLGLAEELSRRGVVTTGIRFHIKGREVGGLDFDRSKAAGTPYQHILMAPQAEVEELLLHDLARHGLTVERGTRLDSLTQTGAEVTAHLIRDGHPEPELAISCRYLIGADGAHSAVRKGLGLAFDGDRYAQRYLLADCRVEWPFDHAHFRVFMNRERIGLFLPLHGATTSRVMTTDLSTEDGARGPLSLAHLQEELRAAMGVPVTLSDPVWTSRYQAHLRQVADYRLGRCFLVGDAAHIHSPAGGQGLNTGLQDAANLAWKLAAVLRTGADPALLESYSRERHPVGVQVLKFSDRLYKFAAGLRGRRARLRDAVGPFLLGRMSAAPLPHRKSFARISQLGLAYPPSAYNVNELLYSLKGPLAGTRAPDARINQGRQLFDLLRDYRLRVVALSRVHLTEPEIAAHTAQLRSIADFGGGLATHLIGRVAGRRDDRVEQADNVQVFEHYGLTEPDSQALYVIRPDGHIAWRMDTIDYDACRRFLATLHGGIAACEDYRQDQAA
ncbi:FAD-dependent monooxygenase [Crossiella cryophila]|uniref:2-polyprenyl-6-methoxyphenol hydroxylase-like FAD-dependent oxidoreductase n=1 Tax=Crossiella cryophila TaxID=43355 RepID=A0A7W7FUW9_9PSEU|nr:FAD-dependent monooxygenase [Crossiella cryophila]MBB4678667.1 2-polyprenyl-6-methoxyphenol hydroxylase-like FAD-dependent oxidoreductase [Crossiella cryophila]